MVILKIKKKKKRVVELNYVILSGKIYGFEFMWGEKKGMLMCYMLLIPRDSS